MNIQTKIFGTLISMAFVSMIVYAAALFHVEPVRAAEILLYNNVAIEDGSMRPLALSLNAKVDTNVGVTLPGAASATATAKTSTIGNSTSSAASSNANINAKMNADANADFDFELPVNVNTPGDLEVYTRTLEQQDKKISKIEVDDSRIFLAYRQPARFLGIIPVSVLANVEVDAQGNVSIDYPWYTFLTVKEDEKLKAELQAKVGEILGTGGASGTVTGTTTVAFSDLSSRSKAKILQAIHLTLMENKVEADTEVR